ncbi:MULTISPECIES: type III secretion effector protein [unclassified Pseudomonas]|uniref:type III secretion effector protein n=1 Tax=unclassified Pseudomonas TaxID=196821 RepID=UPI0015B38104|nr:MULTISPECIES: type III secretion effector protein [unclassified Pseudomonas]MCS4315129.1 hypothetical protein [Pseudomonas sp. BIGb0381]
MSVSMLDTPVPTSSNPDSSQVKSSPAANNGRAAPVAPSFSGQNAANVSFQSRESAAGPVFGGQSQATARNSVADPAAHQKSASAQSGLLDQIRHWVNPWLGWGRPPHHPGWSNPPPRPMPVISNPPPRPFPTLPGRPDPQYSLKNNEDLAMQLRDNFNAFRDPRNPGYISADSIRAMANKGWSPFPSVNENIRLAKELLRRPELMSALDRHTSTGALDGLIDRNNVNAVIYGQNYFKYKTDKELAGEMLEHFNELKGSPWNRELNVNDLRKLAAENLTGDSPRDHLIQLSQEILKRSDVLRQMDDLLSRPGDHKISWAGLYFLAR